MLLLDGSRGEGGGQILRSALALALATGRPFRIERIRARRRKPGLMSQHLTAVRAAARIGDAEVEGDALGSTALTFRPRAVIPGSFDLAVGTAGSTTLVLQTVLPALVVAPGPSTLRLTGGTHNAAAPPFDFLARSFLPLVNRMGPRVEARLERPGFYPAGGGAISVTVAPCERLAGFELLEPGELRARRARAVVSRLPETIADRELEVLERELGWEAAAFGKEVVRDARGPGNVVVVEIESQNVTEVVTGFGARGVRAEDVAGRAAAEARRYLESGVPVGEHLADQLLIPLALAGGGKFRTLAPSTHTRTNIEVVREFLEIEIGLEERGPEEWVVSIGGIAALAD